MEPPDQLLVLDEPINNLDQRTTQASIDALASYRGGLPMVAMISGSSGNSVSTSG